jgi:hypothetical protein
VFTNQIENNDIDTPDLVRMARIFLKETKKGKIEFFISSQDTHSGCWFIQHPAFHAGFKIFTLFKGI